MEADWRGSLFLMLLAQSGKMLRGLGMESPTTQVIRGSGIHFRISTVERTAEEERWMLAEETRTFSCHWLTAKNAQGFGDGIPKDSGLVMLVGANGDVLAADVQVVDMKAVVRALN